MLIRLLISAGYPAGLIAVWGVTSLIIDRDVIAEPDAGPLLGPFMAVGATLVTACWVFGVRRRVALPALGAVASVYLAMLVVGFLGYYTGRGNSVTGVVFAAHSATSPFVVGAALLSAVAVILAFATSARTSFDRPSPRG